MAAAHALARPSKVTKLQQHRRREIVAGTRQVPSRASGCGGWPCTARSLGLGVAAPAGASSTAGHGPLHAGRTQARPAPRPRRLRCVRAPAPPAGAHRSPATLYTWRAAFGLPKIFTKAVARSFTWPSWVTCSSARTGRGRAAAGPVESRRSRAVRQARPQQGRRAGTAAALFMSQQSRWRTQNRSQLRAWRRRGKQTQRAGAAPHPPERM